MTAFAPGQAAAIDLDIEAERAFLRTAPGGGAPVTVPAPGQTVVFHLDWRVTGSGGPVGVSIRAVLDGQVFCALISSASAGDLFTTFCNAGWVATTGQHTLRWEVDHNQNIVEIDEGNNSTSLTWSTGGALTATPTSVASPTPLPTFVPSALDAFARGDTDCSINTSAADVTAQVRALGGDQICDNDDCDRDGDIDGDDVDCAARCVFGRCPVPPGAPRVTGVEAVSVPRIRPFSVVRITGENLGTSVVGLNLRVGDREGYIIDLESPAEILALIPGTEPVPQELTILNGEIESAPFLIDVEAPIPVGTPDTLEDLVGDTLAVLDEVLAMDSASLFGDFADVIVPQLQQKRDELPGLLRDVLENPEFTGEFASLLNEAIDASGTPEMIRGVLASLQADGQAATLAATGVDLARAGIAAGNTMIAGAAGAGETLAATGSVEAGGAAAGGVIAAANPIVVAGVVVLGGIAVAVGIQDRPVITDVSPEIIEPGQRLMVSGFNLGGFGDIEPNLILVNDQGQQIPVTDSVDRGEGFLVFEIPDAIGVCGSMTGFLRVPVIGRQSLYALPLNIRPVLDGLGEDVVSTPADTTLTAAVKGVVGCKAGSFAEYEAAEGDRREEITFDPMIVHRNLLRYRLPNLVPGRFFFTVNIRGRVRPPSLDVRSFLVGSSLTDFLFRCPTELKLFNSTIEELQCFRDAIPDLSFLGGSDEFRVDAAPAGIVDPFTLPSTAVLRPLRPGKTIVTAELRRVDGGLDRLIVKSRQAIEVEVVDDTPPTIQLTRNSPEVVGPGDVIQVKATAMDDYAVKELRLVASGPVPAGQQMQTFDACNPLFPETVTRSCQTEFTVDVVAASGSSPVVVSVIAVDFSDNPSAPAELVFRLPSGGIGGTVRDAETGNPIPGATIQLLDLSDQLIDEVTSGGGSFLFSDVPEGSYSVRVSASGFATRTERVTITSGETLDLSIELYERSGAFLFAVVEVHDLRIESCFINREGQTTVLERYDRRTGVFDTGDPLDQVALDNLLNVARNAAPGGWVRSEGRLCPIYRNVLGVTVTQVEGLLRDQAQALVRELPPPPDPSERSVPGCEILNVC